MNKLMGKVALVTGGGSGIGRGICKALASEGASVVVAGRRLEKLDETVKQIKDAGGHALAVQLDVANEQSWQSVMDTTLKHYQQLNILVNNAGVQFEEDTCEEQSIEQWRQVFSINLDGVMLGVKAAIGVMKGNSESNAIINISSTAALGPSAYFAYSVSKAGLGMLTKFAAAECQSKGYNIRVNGILPGVIKDGMGNEVKESAWYQKLFRQNFPASRLGKDSDIAKAVLFLASDDTDFIAGTELVVDGGAAAGLGVLMAEKFKAAVINERGL